MKILVQMVRTAAGYHKVIMLCQQARYLASGKESMVLKSAAAPCFFTTALRTAMGSVVVRAHRLDFLPMRPFHPLISGHLTDLRYYPKKKPLDMVVVGPERSYLLHGPFSALYCGVRTYMLTLGRFHMGQPCGPWLQLWQEKNAYVVTGTEPVLNSTEPDLNLQVGQTVHLSDNHALWNLQEWPGGRYFTVKLRMNFDMNGQLEGPTSEIHTHGNVLRQKQYHKDKKHGLFLMQTLPGLQPQEVVRRRYVEGVPIGNKDWFVTSSWGDRMVLEKRSVWKRCDVPFLGAPSLRCLELKFDPDGRELERQEFQGRLRHGIHVVRQVYDGVAVVVLEANYSCDQLHGVYQTWGVTLQGNRVRDLVGKYQQGELSGRWERYDGSDRLRVSGEFEGGQRHGYLVRYDSWGRMTSWELFYYNMRIAGEHWHYYSVLAKSAWVKRRITFLGSHLVCSKAYHQTPNPVLTGARFTWEYHTKEEFWDTISRKQIRIKYQRAVPVYTVKCPIFQQGVPMLEDYAFYKGYDGVASWWEETCYDYGKLATWSTWKFCGENHEGCTCSQFCRTQTPSDEPRGWVLTFNAAGIRQVRAPVPPVAPSPSLIIGRWQSFG